MRLESISLKQIKVFDANKTDWVAVLGPFVLSCLLWFHTIPRSPLPLYWSINWTTATIWAFRCLDIHRRHINRRASNDFTQILLDPCSGALNNITGQFGSVDRDGNGYYEHDEHCLWNITVVNGTVIQLKFLSMDILNTDGSLCEQDYIKV